MTRRWLLVLAACGAISAWRATVFLPALDGAPAFTLPPVTAPPGPRLARRVVLVIIDGLRLDATDEMPTLAMLRARGVHGRAQAPFPSLSGPSYTTIATGVSPRYSGVRTNDELAEVGFDSIVTRVHAAGMRVGYAATTRTPFPALFPALDDVASDSHDLRDDLVVVVIMEVDRAGHRSGGDSPAYREAAHAQDATLARVVAGIDLERDAIVVCADHGHANRGGHGGTSVDELSVPLVLAGAGVRRGATLDGVGLDGVGSTIAALLGISAPAGGGPTLTDALAIDGPRATTANGVRVATADGDRVATADRERASRLAALAADADREADDALGDARRRRIPLAALGIAAIIVLLVRLRPRAPAIIAATSFPIAFFGTATVGQRWLADPGVSGDALSLWLEHARYGLAASLAWSIAMVVLARTSKQGRSVAAATMIAAGVVIGIAIATWAIAGHELAITLPSPVGVTITPVAYMAVAWFAIAAGLGLIVARRTVRSRG